MALIRDLTPDDWPAAEKIYADGIATGYATFETATPAWETFDEGHLAGHRLVADAEGEVVGWAALAPTSGRACYSGVVESSVYVAARMRGQGLGQALMEALVAGARRSGRSRRASSPRTRRASRSTNDSGSVSSAGASGSPSSAASGATRCCSSSGSDETRTSRRPSGGRPRTRCGRRSRTSSRLRDRSVAAVPRSECSRGRTRGPGSRSSWGRAGR